MPGPAYGINKGGKKKKKKKASKRSGSPAAAQVKRKTDTRTAKKGAGVRRSNPTKRRAGSGK